ncbi:kelch repeat-containing protein [Winogradskyella sp. R77965]|uniref:Kelch repeat-containing protein n=1 Tax=Winogradskyella sp. R77965 TaxID=3093872 RepID=UPI0037DD1378
MKQVSCVLLFFLFSNFFHGQTTNFISASDMPSAKSATSSANDGSYIYVTNGFSLAGGYTMDVFKFDITNNSWSVLTNSTIAKRFGSAAIVGNNLFIFNGYISNNAFNDAIEVVDTSTGTVSNTGLVNPEPAAAAGVSVDGNIVYSFGGSIATGYSNKLYAFNTATLTLTELGTMPVALETKGEVVNGKLYVIGGFNGSVSDKIYVYDIATDAWTDEYTLPQGLSANATAVVGNKIYVVGDFSDQNFTGYFDTATNTFTETSSNLINRRHASAEGVNDELYVMGGNTSSSGTSALSGVQTTNTTLSVGGYDEKLISVYPNPASNYIYFSKKIDRLMLINMTGSIIKKASDIKSLDIQDLQDGFYFLKLEDNNNMETIKLIKN